MNNITILGKNWFDKINGNSYFSCRVYIDGEHVLTCPYEYGYGDFYIQRALSDLKKLGYINTESIYELRDKQGISIIKEKFNCLKRELDKEEYKLDKGYK